MIWVTELEEAVRENSISTRSETTIILLICSVYAVPVQDSMWNTELTSCKAENTKEAFQKCGLLPSLWLVSYKNLRVGGGGTNKYFEI